MSAPACDHSCCSTTEPHDHAIAVDWCRLCELADAVIAGGGVPFTYPRSVAGGTEGDPRG